MSELYLKWILRDLDALVPIVIIMGLFGLAGMFTVVIGLFSIDERLEDIKKLLKPKPKSRSKK